MYEFKPVSERIQALYDRIRDRVIEIDDERARIVTESYQQTETTPWMLRIPLATKAVCERKTILVEDDDIFVGNQASSFCASNVWPEWDGPAWVLREIDTTDLWKRGEDGRLHRDAPNVKLAVRPDAVEAFRQMAPYWKTHRFGETLLAWQPDGYQTFSDAVVSNYEPGLDMAGLALGHLIPGHKKILERGYDSIREEAQGWLDAHEGDFMGEDIDRCLFYTSVTIVCDAASIMIERYAEACRQKAAACDDPARVEELERMAESLSWIAHKPARTFWEACQGALLYHLLLYAEAKEPALALGRFDQYTWPYLKADLEAGRLDEETAQELVDAFFLKSTCFYNACPPAVADIAGANNTYQHTTIGGVDPDTGEDATNPVTYMVLESVGRLSLHDPTVSLRINANSPDKLWECALATSKRVGGLPLFQNDEVVIPALQRELGFSLRDARDYGVIGCQEFVGCGTDFPAPNGITPPHETIYFSALLDMAINDGVNPKNDVQAPVRTGLLEDMATFDEVKDAFEKMARWAMRWFVSIHNYTEYLMMRRTSLAALSMGIEGCMESGKDCTQGGAKYNSYGGTAVGLATAADSLTAIRYMVFDKKLCSARELREAVLANWEGHEDLRQRVLNEVPHYGNDDPYADEQMRWVTDLYCKLCGECHSVRSKKYKAGMYGASDHIAQGKQTWATPDGRKDGQPLADASSPAQGRDVNGPTAVFNSSCCLGHERFMDGLALNLRIHPSAVSDDEGVGKLKAMTQAYFENGGMEVQYNIVSAETMRAAQKDPAAYRDLVVRIAGFSAYFVEMSADLQNDIISRTENVF
ncbi:MAG TPA: hypothetical protein IAC12_05170 [Candidatus Aphodovivens avistercoris]|nr:hypothetical protein [Candidatus Aphodovivens avistercoris]